MEIPTLSPAFAVVLKPPVAGDGGGDVEAAAGLEGVGAALLTVPAMTLPIVLAGLAVLAVAFGEDVL